MGTSRRRETELVPELKPTRHPLAPKGHLQVGVRRISIWPEGQLVGALAEPTVLLTDFDDTARYHPKLIERILAMEHDPKLRDFFFRGGCGTKVRRPDTWGAPEAEHRGHHPRMAKKD